MAGKSKRTKENQRIAAESEIRSLEDAVKAVKRTSNAKFDETVDVAIQLGIDPRKSDQMVRGTVQLPEGTGRKIRIAVVAEQEHHQAAIEAGADKAGLDDLIEAIKGGDLGFDVLIATPGVMRSLSQVAKMLGPKGLMPNPKSGTVTKNVAETVAQFKKGQVQFRNDKAGIIHLPVGKASFGEDALLRNIMGVIDALKRIKPASSKGIYFRKASLSGSMGAGITFDIAAHR